MTENTTKLSRRDFLKGSVAGALGLAVAGITGMTAHAEEAAVYTPGTYSATAVGIGEVTVTMTFDTTSITDVQIDVSNETPGIGAVQGDNLARLILDAQGAEFDGVTGATLTSDAVRKASESCIAQAKGIDVSLLQSSAEVPAEAPAAQSIEWLGEEPEIADADIAEVLETEVLVVGAGMSGLVATMTAVQAGAKTLCVEKNPYVGPLHDYIGAVGTRQAAEAGVEVDRNKLLNEAARYADFRCNQRLIKTWMDNSAEMLDWLETLQDNLEVVIEPDVGGEEGGTSYYVPPIMHCLQQRDPIDWIDQQVFLPGLIEEQGGEIILNTPMVKLVHEQNKVSGIIAKRTESGDYIRINASKGVILCTGGYAGNPEMLRACNPGAAASVVSLDCLESNKGDGIKAGLWAGGVKDEVGTVMFFDRGHMKPGMKAGYIYEGDGKYNVQSREQFVLGSQPFLKVNEFGERFANESCPYDYIVHAAAEYPSHAYCMIWDSNWKEDVLRFHTIGCSRIDGDPESTRCLNSYVWHRSEYYEGDEGEFQVYKDRGELFVCDTLEELAEKLKLPVETFMKTVERYNELYDKQNDEDFGKEAYRLSALRSAPYYGMTIGGCMLTTLDGLKIDEYMRVLNREGHPIENLYAAGDCSGGFFSGNYPEYLIGIALGRTLTFGRRAAKVATGTLEA